MQIEEAYMYYVPLSLYGSVRLIRIGRETVFVLVTLSNILDSASRSCSKYILIYMNYNRNWMMITMNEWQAV